jgi:hypothetical protein
VGFVITGVGDESMTGPSGTLCPPTGCPTG